MRAHRFAWEERNGLIPSGLFLCHHCDNPPCVRPDHMFIGTAEDNTRDGVAKGRIDNFPSTVGRQNGRAILTEDAVKQIRALYATGTMSQASIAAKLGTTQDRVSSIVRRKSWKHI